MASAIAATAIDSRAFGEIVHTGQFEQVLNARYLEREGYGMAANEIPSGRLGQVIEALPEFQRNLALYRQDGNKDLLESLDQTLEEEAAF